MNAQRLASFILFPVLAAWACGAAGPAAAAGMKPVTCGMKISLSVGARAEWLMSDRDLRSTIDAVTGKLLAKG